MTTPAHDNTQDGPGRRSPKRKLIKDLENRPFAFSLAEDRHALLSRYGGGVGSTAVVLWTEFVQLAYERDALTFSIGMGELLRRTHFSCRKQMNNVIARLEAAKFLRVKRDPTRTTEREMNRYTLLRGPFRRAAKGDKGSGQNPLPSGHSPRGDTVHGEGSRHSRDSVHMSSLTGEVLHTSPRKNEDGTPASATLRGADGPRSRERVSPERSDTATACNGDTTGGDSSGDTAPLGRCQGPRRVPDQFAGKD